MTENIKHSETTEEQLEREILDIVSKCVHCRFCLPNCPRMEITGGWEGQGAAGILTSLYYALKYGLLDEHWEQLRDRLFACANCKSCFEHCSDESVGINTIEAIRKGRQLLLERMKGPMPQQGKALDLLAQYGNPYGNPPSERTAWAKDLGIPFFSKEAALDVLLYVGCTAAYDERIQRVSRAVVQLLKAAQVKFGILSDEECCGYPADKIGEASLFEEVMNKNWAKFKALNVKHIVAICPHGYDEFVKEYPLEMGKDITIEHYTQFFSELIDQGRLSFKKTISKKVTYQDPCYLGRHNNIYEQPRKIIKAIPGVSLVEMRRNREDSLCCGGGGGRMWADFEDETERLGNIRVKEAVEAGAEMIVTACPFCFINLDDAVKTTRLEQTLEVKDIAQLMVDAL